MEKAVDRELVGLIGYEILQQYEVFFDYPNSVIKIYDAANAELFRKEKPAAVVVPFYMNGHLPVIAVKAGNKKMYLGIDSGAEANLLDDDYYKMLDKNYLSQKEKETVIGLDQKERDAVSAMLGSVSVKKEQLPKMKFLFLDLDGLSSQFENRLDGLLAFLSFNNKRYPSIIKRGKYIYGIKIIEQNILILVF